MTTTTNPSAVAAAEQLCQRYRSEHDLAAHVSAHGQIVLRAGAVDAVQMPRVLGDRVRKLLTDSGLHTSIVESIRTDYLTFLTAAAPRGDARPVHLHTAAQTTPSIPVTVPKTDANLFRLAAIRTVAGSQIPLPGPDDPVRRWLCPPEGVLADFDRVAALTIAAGSALRERPGAGR
jgi:hypothetical protein